MRLRRLLIANRGEIACRIMRTAKRLGLATVAVYSDADRRAPHVGLADEAYRIGPPEPQRSYLNTEAILEAAALGACDAIHPGYGFLSENAAFAEACRDADFLFVGPPADAIRAMGAKDTAKTIMAAHGVAVVPGWHGAECDLATLAKAADEIGYPVLIKAVAGGGGKGMRVVETRRALAAAIESARREAESAFGDGRLMLERWLQRPRHVESQVFADRYGNVLALFERDCSVQRRHQKVIEEAPAPGIDPHLRRRLGEAACRAASAIGYEGAGTVEFLLDDDGSFYFMEMNTRLQVEHPVTEMVTGIDLVEWQLRVAAGEPLPLAADDLAIHGHAFEARIYAEDPGREFLPAAGVLRHLRFPDEGPHVRVDAGARSGDAVGIHYDPLIAKVIVWDRDRPTALNRLRRALEETQIVGPVTNVAFLRAIAGHPEFAAGDADTRFIDRHRHDLLPKRQPVPPRHLALATLAVLLARDREASAAARRSLDPFSPWHATSGWRLNEDNHHDIAFLDGEVRIAVTVHYRASGQLLELPGASGPLAAAGELDDDGDLIADLGGVRVKATIVRAGDEITVIAGGSSHRLVLDDPAARAELKEAETGSLKSPMPGKVIRIDVRAGDSVQRGAALLVIEAMKMEHTVTAPADGTVERVHFEVGEQVAEGATLVSFAEPADGEDGDPGGAPPLMACH
ncbi:MAG: acetyl/propionyl/methylcrotonyl-CoA carboxylase subunit alpha [Rhodospirillales bacterium]|nr:acetyl/propionyl/methylcrotonyl-CoA carboxylase subunit alpha [Rhodospirillales bacterium]